MPSPCPWLWGRRGVKQGWREITDNSSPGKGTTKTQEGCDPSDSVLGQVRTLRFTFISCKEEIIITQNNVQLAANSGHTGSKRSAVSALPVVTLQHLHSHQCLGESEVQPHTKHVVRGGGEPGWACRLRFPGSPQGYITENDLCPLHLKWMVSR